MFRNYFNLFKNKWVANMQRDLCYFNFVSLKFFWISFLNSETLLIRINFYTKKNKFLPNQVVLTCLPTYFFQVKVSKSQTHFFLKLHCPKNKRNIWQNSALAFEIYWSLEKSGRKFFMRLHRISNKICFTWDLRSTIFWQK